MSYVSSFTSWTCDAGSGDGSTAFGKVALSIAKSAWDLCDFACFALGLRTELKALDLF